MERHLLACVEDIRLWAVAREAVDLMGDIVNKYGYASSGESFSIANNSPSALTPFESQN